VSVGGEVDRLFKQGLPVLERVARRWARRLGNCMPADDVFAFGRIGLFDAATTFDPNRGTFEIYAAQKIGWAIVDGVRQETHGRTAAARARALGASDRLRETPPEVPAGEDGMPTREACEEGVRSLLDGHAAALVFGLMRPMPDMSSFPDEGQSPEDRIARAELTADLERAVRALPDRERALVERHYFEDQRFDHVAEGLGISKSWASRLHTKAMVSLGRTLREHGPE
jgi:RNA polymerase sigma factor FliA